MVYVKSLHLQQTLARLDYGGISILIFGSMFPVLYYGMACEQVLTAKWIYGSIQMVSCIACFIVTLIPKFDQPQFQKARGIMYIILGLSCGVMFIMFEFMKEYIAPNWGWGYALGGYIYI